MEKESVQAYANRIAQANRSELIVIMYEIVLEDLKDAKTAYQKGEMGAFERVLKHAQKFVAELMAALNYGYRISVDLMNLYIYVNQCIINSLFSKKMDELEGAEKVMNILLKGFQEISHQDNSPALMEHTQQVYAGLTYGRGTLNETYLDPNESNRGFRI